MAASTPRRGVIAEFAGAREMLEAARRLREEGYSRLDTFSPYDLEEADSAIGLEGRGITWWALGAAAVGGAFAYWVQWYTNGWDYPIDVGGRPLLSTPAWIPIVFETVVLFGAFAAFVGLWVEARLPALWHPVFEVEGFERATVDRFFVAVGADDPRYDPRGTAAELAGLGALRVLDLPGER